MKTPLKYVSWVKQMISRQLVEVNKISRADSVIKATCCRSFAGKKKTKQKQNKKRERLKPV